MISVLMIFLGAFVIIALAVTFTIISGKGREKPTERANMSLKKAYLYLVSVIALVIMVVGSIQLLDMALKTWVFTKADRDFYSTTCYSVKPGLPEGGSATCSAEEEAKQKQQQEESRAAQKQRQASTAIAMIVIATPVWWYHWTQARKEA